MKCESYSVTFDEGDLNPKRKSIQGEMGYNYRALVVNSTTINYSTEFLGFADKVTVDMEEVIEPEVSKEQLRKEYWPFLEPQPILSKLLIKTK